MLPVAQTTITQKGQVTIPKKFREKFDLWPYSKVYIETGKDYIKITPAKDILDLAGKYKPIKKKPVLKAREEMERFYRRF